VTPLDLVEAVGGILQVIRGKAIAPTKTSAGPVLALWRALEYPELAQFRADVELVAEAAHNCPHPIFAREIRAEDWPEGTDRQWNEANVCRQAPKPPSSGATWDRRLEVAREWASAGRPAEGWGGPPRAPPRGAYRPSQPVDEEPPTFEELQAWDRERRTAK